MFLYTVHRLGNIVMNRFNRGMNDMRFYILYNSISIILGQLSGDKRLCTLISLHFLYCMKVSVYPWN